MDKLELLEDKLRENFNTYKEWLMQQDKNVVFNNSYETAIKYEMSEFLNYDKLDNNTVDILVGMGNPLNHLYEEYMKADGINIVNEINRLLDVMY